MTGLDATTPPDDAFVGWGVPPRIRWKLPELLERERVTTNKLAVTIRERIDSSIDRTSVYRLLREPKRPEMATVAAILAALEIITGKRYELTDLMDFERDGEG